MMKKISIEDNGTEVSIVVNGSVKEVAVMLATTMAEDELVAAVVKIAAKLNYAYEMSKKTK